MINIKCDLTSDEESSYFGEMLKDYPPFFKCGNSISFNNIIKIQDSNKIIEVSLITQIFS